MNFSSELLPTSYILVSVILYLVLFYMALRYAPWYRLKNTSDANILFAATLVVWLFWRGSAGITPGMEYHLLMMTALTLMFGWAFALLSASIVQIGLTLEGLAVPSGFAINLLLNGALPILTIHYFYRLVYQKLPHNFFIYIFVVSFFGAALTMFLNRAAGLGLLLMSDAYTLQQLGDDPWFMLLMLFPEGFLNGVVMTLLVVYRPEWVASFDDRSYLYQHDKK
jgi:uncharacterized membrane protein